MMPDTIELQGNVDAMAFRNALKRLLRYMEGESADFQGEPKHIYRAVYLVAKGIGMEEGMDDPDRLNK